MDLKDHNEAVKEFTKEEAMPSIWSIKEEEESRNEDKAEEEEPKTVVSPAEEAELERPSFLRRLTKRGVDHKEDKPADTDSSKTDGSV